MRAVAVPAAQGQAGQILLFTALIMTVLIGMVGLALDYGFGAMAQRQEQNAVDAAALGAAYEIGTGATEASALSMAQLLAQKHGFSSPELTLTFLDSNGAATSTASQVATVKASLTHQTPTVFLRVLKINSQTESAQGAASVGGAAGACVLCVLDGNATAALAFWNMNSVTVTGGGVAVNSSSAFAAILAQLNTVTTPSFSVVGNYLAFGYNQITPMPQAGAKAVADPLIKAPVPACPSGNPYNQASVTLGNAGSVTAKPGTYTYLTITNANSATLNPGVYCIAGGGLSISDVSSLTAHGVLIYLTCGLYPSPSACQPHQTGAALTISDLSSASFSGLTSGTDQGILIFADRNNIATHSFSQFGVNTFSGTIYAPAGQVTFDNFSSASAINSMIVADTFWVTQSNNFNLAYTASQNYAVGAPPALIQ